MNRRWWIVAGAVAVTLVVATLAWRGLRGEEADTVAGSPSPPATSAVASPSPAASPTAPARVAPSAAPSRSPKTAPVPRPGPPGQRWKVAPGQPWQWQLTTPVDLSVDVPIYDIDGFDNSAEVVRKLHAAGRKVICYVEVGSAADFRPDYGSFPKSILGKSNGWPGERSVDIRRVELLAPILAKRFDMCKAKGFDAVEPDLMENYTADTGFPVTAADQLAFNRFVSRLAHERGMAVALKNDPAQVDQLVGDFDFAVVEECAEFDECDRYLPFIRAGKAVLHVEYKLEKSDFCAEARANRFSSMRKSLDLDAHRQPC